MSCSRHDGDGPAWCMDCHPENFPASVTGKYFGPNPTDTERASGEEIEVERRGPIRRGGAMHRVLLVYADGQRRTAYDASFECSGDFHARRRESTRLEERGFLVKDGTLPNRAKNGRPHVAAYRVTASGHAENARLGPLL